MMERRRLRLGHIVYSNCLPVHAGVLRDTPGWLRLVEGVPGVLNGMLREGGLDVAPSSSIEYARNARRYKVIPDLVIGCSGPVRSIRFLSRVDPQDLADVRVAVPTASATSVALLQILLERRWGVSPRLYWFDQARSDPFAGGAEAALFIGDVALDPDLHPEVPVRVDLGEAWWDETGLPFAFALWQTTSHDAEALRCLHRTLVRSRDHALADLEGLAGEHATRFGFEPSRLAEYWRTLRFHLDADMEEGLRTFFRYAAEIGAVPEAPSIRLAG